MREIWSQSGPDDPVTRAATGAAGVPGVVTANGPITIRPPEGLAELRGAVAGVLPHLHGT
jgi:hypothetical protein